MNSLNKPKSKAFFMQASVVLLIALAIRLPTLYSPGTITTDDYLYAWVGRNIVSGHGITDYHGSHTIFPPGYPFAIGAAYLVTRDLELAIRAANFLMGFALIIIVALTTARLWGRRAGLYGALLTAINPSLIIAAFVGGSETAFALLSVLTVYLTLLTLEGKLRFGVLLGIITGCAVLVRPEALLFLPVSVLLIVTSPGVRRKAILASAIALSLAITLAPYSVFMHKTEHTWLPTGKVKTLAVDDPALTKNPEIALYSLTSDNRALSGDFIDSGSVVKRQLKDPLLLAKKYAKNAAKCVIAIVLAMGMPVLLLILFGIPGILVKTGKRSALITLIPLSIPFAVAAFVVRERYLVEVIPVAMIWATMGLLQLQQNQRIKTKVLKAGIAGLILCWAAISGMNGLRLCINIRANEAPEHKVAGLWMYNHGYSGRTVMSRKPFAAFYANAPWEILPYAEYHRMIAFAKNRRVRIIVIDERWTKKLRPQLAFLLEPSNTPKELRLLKVIGSRKNKPAPQLVIYELLPEEQAPRDHIKSDLVRTSLVRTPHR